MSETVQRNRLCTVFYFVFLKYREEMNRKTRKKESKICLYHNDF